MPDQAPIILLTRPAAQSKEFRAMLPENADVVISPVINIQPVDFSVDVGQYDALIFTSGNGVRSAARCLKLSGIKAITVGDSTAHVAAGFGMSVVAAGGGADALIDTVAREYPAGKVLFVRGRHTRGQVVETLKNRGLDTDMVISYDQFPVPLAKSARAVLCGNRRVILPLFSPRSAKLVAAEAQQCAASAPLGLVAMSAEISAAWNGPEPARKVVAAQRTAGAMADEIVRCIAHRY